MALCMMAVPVMRWVGRRIEEVDSMMERMTPRERWEAMYL